MFADDYFEPYAFYILFVVTVITFAIHTYILASFLTQLRKLQSFTLMCFNKSIFVFVICNIQLFWVVFKELFPSFSLYNSSLAEHATSLTMHCFCYTGIHVLHILMSLNRIAAICSHKWYDQMFTNRKTVLYLLIVWVICGTWYFYWLFSGAGFYFDSDHLTWDIAVNDNATDRLKNITGYIVYTYALTCTLLNTFSFIKLFKNNNKTTTISNDAYKQRLHRTRLRFIQTICQDIPYVIDMIFFLYIFKIFETSRWWLFFTLTIIWLAALITDGLVVIFFSHSLRKPQTSRLFSKPKSGGGETIVVVTV